MQDWIIQIMNHYGYLGVFLLIAVENLFPPIPSEVILTFGGFMTTYTNMEVWGVILFATLGSVFGAIVLYCIGLFLNRERLERWLESRWGRMLHLKVEDVRKAEGWFAKRGKATVFFCRFIPIVRSLISIPAGMARMNFITFTLLTTIGTCIWNIVLVYLGAFFGASWEVIAGYIDTYSSITLYVLVALFVIAAIVYYFKRVVKKDK
ncbi:DedA family protein [Paenibacillus marinisediminis]